MEGVGRGTCCSCLLGWGEAHLGHLGAQILNVPWEYSVPWIGSVVSKMAGIASFHCP